MEYYVYNVPGGLEVCTSAGSTLMHTADMRRTREFLRALRQVRDGVIERYAVPGQWRVFKQDGQVVSEVFT